MEKKARIGNFQFIKTSIEGVYIIETRKYRDNRGCFIEIYKKDIFKEAGLGYEFVQENQSQSTFGVLRGLHFQKEYPQAKLARCIRGRVFDVCVDLRQGSKTFGKWIGVVLSAKKNNMILVPRGFAHGVLTLTKKAVFSYKCDDIYHPNDEGGIVWNDPKIGILWPLSEEHIVLSDKDKKWSVVNETITCGGLR